MNNWQRYEPMNRRASLTVEDAEGKGRGVKQSSNITITATSECWVCISQLGSGTEWAYTTRPPSTAKRVQKRIQTNCLDKQKQKKTKWTLFLNLISMKRSIRWKVKQLVLLLKLEWFLLFYSKKKEKCFGFKLTKKRMKVRLTSRIRFIKKRKWWRTSWKVS